MSSHRILELFSGIGGMHFAWKESYIDGEIVAAIDINTVANHVYSYNFKNSNVLNKNIQALSADLIRKLNPDVLLMSPPCQPFTRNGLQKDTEDVRSFSFHHLLTLLKDLKSIDYILMENVKGFETSKSRNAFITTLKECGYYHQEFLLTPTQFGIPNSRLRYYCLARKTPFNLVETDLLYEYPDKEEKVPFNIETIIDETCDESYDLSSKYLKRALVLDICYPDSNRSCCFTKAYTHFLEGTGSVFTNSTQEEVKNSFAICSQLDSNEIEYQNVLRRLKLRFFTPKEVSRLMTFPASFEFPKDISRKQCYRLLGNSINVKVVSELIKYLINKEFST